MTTLRKAAQQALEVLILAPTIKVWTSDDDYCEQESPECKAAITALRTALAEPEERQTMTPKELAASLKRGEKWIVIEEKT